MMEYFKLFRYWFSMAQVSQGTVVLFVCALAAFLFAFLGIGWGVGRIFNKQWKITASFGFILLNFLLSLLIAFGVVVAFGISAVDAKVADLDTAKENIIGRLNAISSNGRSLKELTFQKGLVGVRDHGGDINGKMPAYDYATSFDWPGSTEEARTKNKKLFCNIVTATILFGEQPTSELDEKVELTSASSLGLSGISPYTASILSDLWNLGDTDDSKAIYTAFTRVNQGQQTIDLTGEWYKALCKEVVNKSSEKIVQKFAEGERLKEFSRTNLVLLLILPTLFLLLVTSWEALSDIRVYRETDTKHSI